MACGFPETGGMGIWISSQVVDSNQIAGIIGFSCGSCLSWDPDPADVGLLRT